MIDDGLFNKIPLPDIVLGQHAVPTRAGTIGTRPGRVLGFLDSLAVRVYGKLGYDAGVGSAMEIATGDDTWLFEVDLSGDDQL